MPRSLPNVTIKLEPAQVQPAAQPLGHTNGQDGGDGHHSHRAPNKTSVIVGVVVGSIAVAAVVALGAFFLRKRRRRSQLNDEKLHATSDLPRRLLTLSSNHFAPGRDTPIPPDVRPWEEGFSIAADASTQSAAIESNRAPMAGRDNRLGRLPAGHGMPLKFYMKAYLMRSYL